MIVMEIDFRWCSPPYITHWLYVLNMSANRWEYRLIHGEELE